MSKQHESNESTNGTMNADQIAQLGQAIGQSIAAGLVTKETADNEDLSAAIAGAVSESVGAVAKEFRGARQMTSAEYRTATAFNPAGLKPHERPQLLRTYWQNGAQIWLWQITDEDVRLLDQLEPGQFLGGRVTVSERKSSVGGKDDVSISYPTATVDQRLENARHFGTFTELLRKIVHEAANPVAIEMKKQRPRLAPESVEA